MDRRGVESTGRVPHGGDPNPSVVDCSANVNPKTPAGVEGVYRSALGAAKRYPDDGYPEFRRVAADYVGVEPERIVPTAGGLAAIRLAIAVSIDPGDEVLVPAPSFGEYEREVRLHGGIPRFVPHDEILDREPTGCSLAIVCSPNNPTGEVADLDALSDFAERCGRAGTTLLVDEAFLGFTDRPSAATLYREDVIVVRSLTKLFGLPGLRAGFAVAAGKRRRLLESARPAWGLGTPAARVGSHCMRDDEFVRATRERVERERERLRSGLVDAGFDVRASDAPFVLVECAEPDAVLERARRHGIALRDARTFRGLDSHVRIAVRSREVTDRVLEVLVDG
ncbi:aminotransferase class I/II-fold pyridoxal phosphate-dependent enzyme [Halovivax gelatinilyticus]|uniref:aminotransferase class I/II-fold pyridoxal phosphate-dependent enzyme n=1 Tax=Halovivax gelatinilyticus TaxID=2961597 RepID=UPI0020CA7581|nr:aminotransferase class I/II-fold pyridoxal phosphate-dependent enzyme [Halovivax gelatinilyticus]